MAESGPPPGINSFNNDGSFLESFMKLQKSEPSVPEVKPKAPKPLPPIRRKPLVMKMAKLRKPPVVVKPAATAAVLEGKLPAEVVDSEQVKAGDREPTTSTKEPSNIPVASSIGLAARGGLPTEESSVSSGTQQAPGTSSTGQLAGRKRRRNRWSDAPPTATADSATSSTADATVAVAMASLRQSASITMGGQQQQGESGGQNLTPEQLRQVKEQIEMNKLVAEIRSSMDRAVQRKKEKNPNQVVFEYDSDEEVEGGTWEHKKRAEEMRSTLEKAVSLTEMNKGKHHIGDFLPPKELEKFIEKANAIKEGRDPNFSDYKEHKLDEANVGFKLLQKAGWTEGQGLGEKGEGIVDPINQGKTSFDQAGVGAEVPGEVTSDDNPFDTYRKRMMLAYRFRPNPLNNPRRPYY